MVPVAHRSATSSFVTNGTSCFCAVNYMRFCVTTFLKNFAAWQQATIHIRLHDQLQHCLGYAEQKIARIVLGQKLGQVHVRLCHGGLCVVRG